MTTWTWLTRLRGANDCGIRAGTAIAGKIGGHVMSGRVYLANIPVDRIGAVPEVELSNAPYPNSTANIMGLQTLKKCTNFKHCILTPSRAFRTCVPRRQTP
jgi:hypothetical protein